LPTFPIANAVTARDGNLSSITASESPDSVEIPLIETLELIQEPDGSPTEDFTLPTGFQSRQKARQQGR
jgi:hypothetical protein